MKNIKGANYKTIFLSIICSLLVSSAVGAFVYLKLNHKLSNNDLIAQFYAVENAVHFSPHSLRNKMDKGETDYTLIDLRSFQEYEKEHIIGAINIPTYKDPDNSISLDGEQKEKERILLQFRELPKSKDIIVYCYSTPCMTGRKIGKLLVDNGIYVKHLNIGWNEWRYSWNLWNHDGEIPTEYKDYVFSGKEPGKPKIKNSFSPCKVGELGC